MSINIPDSVVCIDVSAFSSCAALREVNFGPNSSLREIGGCAFLNCANLTVVELPQSLETFTSASIFVGCSSLTEFRGKFATSDGLALIDEEGVMWAFACGSGVSDYAIPEGVVEVRSGVFMYCDTLCSLTIPKSVKRFAEANFNGCDNLVQFKGKFASKDGRCLIWRKRLLAVLLNGLTDYSIPQGVKYIDAESSFVGADNLKSIAFPEGLREIVLPSWCEYKYKPLSCVVYPSTLTKFDAYMIAPGVFSKLHIFKGVEAPKTCRYCYLGLKGSTILVPKASFKAYEESLLSGLQYDAPLFKEPGYYPVDRYDGDWGVDNDASRLDTRVEVELIGVEL